MVKVHDPRKITIRATATFSWTYETTVGADESVAEVIEMEERILTEEEPVDTSLERYVNAKVSTPHTVTVEELN